MSYKPWVAIHKIVAFAINMVPSLTTSTQTDDPSRVTCLTQTTSTRLHILIALSWARELCAVPYIFPVIFAHDGVVTWIP